MKWPHLSLTTMQLSASSTWCTSLLFKRPLSALDKFLVETPASIEKRSSNGLVRGEDQRSFDNYPDALSPAASGCGSKRRERRASTSAGQKNEQHREKTPQIQRRPSHATSYHQYPMIHPPFSGGQMREPIYAYGYLPIGPKQQLRPDINYPYTYALCTFNKACPAGNHWPPISAFVTPKRMPERKGGKPLSSLMPQPDSQATDPDDVGGNSKRVRATGATRVSQAANNWITHLPPELLATLASIYNGGAGYGVKLRPIYPASFVVT